MGAWAAWGAWGRTFLFISLKVKKISASNFKGALATTAATHYFKSHRINKPERIISALSARQRCFFINIFKYKKDARSEIGKGVTYTQHIYKKQNYGKNLRTAWILFGSGKTVRADKQDPLQNYGLDPPLHVDMAALSSESSRI